MVFTGNGSWVFMSEFSDGRRRRRLNCGIEPSTRGVGAERVGAAIDKSRRLGAATGAWERLAGGGEPRFGGWRDLCYLVNHRVVGVAYHFGCHIRGFFLVAGFYIDGVAVAVEVDYFHLVFFHAVGA